MTDTYEENYISLLPLLKDCDFNDAAYRLGLKNEQNGNLSAYLYGRKYIISKDGITAEDGKTAKPIHKSLLLFYTVSKGSGEPTNTFRYLHAFSGSLIPSASNTKMTTPLTLKFKDNYSAFSSVLEKIGAVYYESPAAGIYIWVYSLLPKIPCRIVYSEKDEDFPCEISVLLDNNAGNFLEFEQLAFLIGSFSEYVASFNID